MISPYFTELIRQKDHPTTLFKKIPVVSYGLSGHGYDLRLSDKELLLFSDEGGPEIDPKEFDLDLLKKAPIHYDAHGEFFLIPPLTSALGVSVEKMEIPSHIAITCHGKSTYARCGLMIFVTPIEAGWRGNLTIEMFNSSRHKNCRVYANEGIVQLTFHENKKAMTDYETRKGKYQDQPYEVVTAKVYNPDF